MPTDPLKAIETLRAQGFAITLFHPEELQGADPRAVANAMEQEGTEAIADLKSDNDFAQG